MALNAKARKALESNISLVLSAGQDEAETLWGEVAAQAAAEGLPPGMTYCGGRMVYAMRYNTALRATAPDWAVAALAHQEAQRAEYEAGRALRAAKRKAAAERKA